MPCPDARGSRRDEGGDGALHVVGAATGENAVLDDRLERIAGPAFAGWHHVEMAGKAEMRRARAADRDHILGRAVRRLAHDPAVHLEAIGVQRRFEHVEHLAAGGRDAGAGDERLGELDGIDHALTFTNCSDSDQLRKLSGRSKG